MNAIDFSKISIAEVIQILALISAFIMSLFSLLSQNRNARKIKYLEVELSKQMYEHQEQFQKLNNKRFLIIEEIYRQIVIIEMWINNIIQDTEVAEITYASMKGFEKSMEESVATISLKLQHLACYFNLNKIYLDDKTSDVLVKFSEFVLTENESLDNYFYYVSETKIDQEGFNKKKNLLRKKALRYVQEIHTIRGQIESEFKNILGFVQKEKLNIDSHSDLMWVPDPNIIDRYFVENKET